MLDTGYWCKPQCHSEPFALLRMTNADRSGGSLSRGCKRFSLAGSRGDRHLAFLAILTWGWRLKGFGPLRWGWTGRLSDQSVGVWGPRERGFDEGGWGAYN